MRDHVRQRVLTLTARTVAFVVTDGTARDEVRELIKTLRGDDMARQVQVRIVRSATEARTALAGLRGDIAFDPRFLDRDDDDGRISTALTLARGCALADRIDRRAPVHA